MKTEYKVCIIVLMAMLSSTILVPGSDADTSHVISYDDVDKDVTVVFPNGTSVTEGGDLIFTATSETYNLIECGIYFVDPNESGKYYTYTSTYAQSDYSVTYTFENITESSEMYFADMIEYTATEKAAIDAGINESNDDNSETDVPSDTGTRTDSSILIASLVAFASIILLAACLYNLNYFNSVYTKNRENL